MRPACRELLAQVRLDEPGGRVELGERARLHLSNCAACRSAVDGVSRAADAADAAAGPPLDQITRAAVLRRLGPELDDLATTYARRAQQQARWGRFARPVVAVALVAAAALVIATLRGRGGRPARPGATTAVAVRPRSALEPYVIAGALASSPAADSLLGSQLHHLAVPEGARVRARIPGGDLAMIGPGELSIEAAPAGDPIELRQAGGTLLCQLDPDDTAVRIVAGPVTLDSSGGLFSIEDRAPALRVAVLDGAVFARSADTSRLRVPPGQVWSGGELSLLAPDQRAALEEHRASRLSRPAAGRRVAMTDAPAGAEISVAGKIIGTAPLLAWIDRDAEAGTGMGTGTDAEAGTGTGTGAEAGTGTGARSWTPEERYRGAEIALRAGELDEARAYWMDLVKHHPDHPLADMALYELAQLAARRGERTEALHHIARLLDRDRDPALREPASWLRCTLLDDRAACLTSFLAEFPGSAHQHQAREWLERARSAP